MITRPGRLAYNLYNSGAAAVTVSGMLRGIFEIAGNSSDYQTYLMYAGIAMLLISIVIYALTNNIRYENCEKEISENESDIKNNYS